MCKLARLLLAAVASAACGSANAPSSPPRPPQTEARALSGISSTAVAFSPTAPDPPAVAEAPRLVFQVSVRYPATVLYALDRATSSRGADERYRRWLFGDAAAPAWLDAYAARRATWQTSRDSADGSYDAYAACSYGVDTVDALVECATTLLDPGDLDVARAALEQTDALLRQRWLELEPRLRQRQRELQELTSGAKGTDLARLLAKSAQLPDRKQLTFEVVLVARPPGNASRANQSGSYMVIEMVEERSAPRQAYILFHEIAHLAARHAPGRDALEQAFVGHGLPGLVAANLWSEAFATAFGNGLAARELDPTFTPDRSLYQDEAIDALGRALYLRWRDGTEVKLDATLAEQLLELLPSAWPRERWRLVDVFGRMALFSDERDAASILRQGIRPRALYEWVPLPADLTSWTTLSRPLPLLAGATLGTLQTRPDVLQLFGLDPGSVRSRLSAHGSSLYWLHDADDARVLVAARTRDGLLEAARAFAALQRLPEPGWTSLRRLPAASEPLGGAAR